MLIGEKMKEISATISYHEDTCSEKFTTSGGGNSCVSKWENTQHTVENDFQSNAGIVFFLLL